MVGDLLLRLGRGELGLLTVSEVFPMETRAMAIAFFYAVATGVGGIIGPALYGHNIATGNRTTVFYGYLLGRRA